MYEREFREREGRLPEREDRREHLPEYRTQRAGHRELSDDAREISLGTGTILGIFFALALLCAVFFGFGYAMGRRSAQPAVAAVEPTSTGGLFGSLKPSAGNLLGSGSQQKRDAAKVVPAPSAAPNLVPDANEEVPAQTDPQSTSDRTAVVVRPSAKSSSSAPVSATNADPQGTPSMPAVSSSGTAIVQVAAVSHQEDADLLLSALKKRGYAVMIRHEAQDRLLHVQVGPFASKKDADLMRQRLLADGYNAIVK